MSADVSGASDACVKLKLTDDQRKQLEDAFGAELVKRLEHLDVEKIAGYIRAHAHVN